MYSRSGSADADGSNPRQVSRDVPSAQNPTVTPDGAWIVFTSDRPQQPGVYRIRTDSAQASLVAPQCALWPELSPDGRFVLFTTVESDHHTVRVARTEGVPVDFEIRVPAGGDGRARWMPDGRAIAFTGVDEGGATSVFAQDFVPGRDTASTRRKLAGFGSGLRDRVVRDRAQRLPDHRGRLRAALEPDAGGRHRRTIAEPRPLTPARPIVIVGAGIGGLTAAIALRRAGLAVEIYERAPELRELGAGITVQPNAIHALREIGLAEAVEAAGCRITAARLTRADGRMLSTMTDEVYAAAGAPAVALHRGTLQRVLLSSLSGEGPRCGRAAIAYEARPDGVILRFADDIAVEGALLVGADGLRSAMRAQLLNDGEPRYAGYTSWRGVADTREGVGAIATEAWGRGQRFGLVPIDGERTYWFATHNASAGGRDDSELARETLLRLFHGWHPPIRDVLLATPRDTILRTDIHDRPPAARWGEGRVTLLGDAAHPMTPNLGQGACQAIEDAVVLARALAAAAADGDPAPALRRYEAARAPRANAVVAAARRLGAIGQAEGALTCRVRDALMALTPDGVARRQALAAWVFPGLPGT